jgi:hypothetical protein
MLAPFVCRADNGKWQPNYSSLGGYLATGAIANLFTRIDSRSGPGVLKFRDRHG